MTWKSNCALVVDDDPISIWLQKEVLKTNPEIRHTHEAGNGAEAMDFITAHCASEQKAVLCPDLIFLDLNMPVMDGFEFLEALAKANITNKDQIRIVVITSSSNPRDAQRLEPYNVWRYINKPLTPEKVELLFA